MEVARKSIGFGITLLVLGLSTIAGLLGAYRRAWTCDDAFISFRYALNLIEGRGLVFNPGEYVEGYTNALWTLLSAGAMLTGLSPETGANIMSLFCFAVLLGGMLHLGRWFFPETLPGSNGPDESTAARLVALPVCVGALALHGHMMIFATSGLETMAFTMLVTLGTLLVIRDYARDALVVPPGRAGFGLLTLACLTRPDGLVFYGAVGLGTLYLEFRRRRTFREIVAMVLRTHIWLLIVFPIALSLRFAYYGALVPNTFYAKSAYAGYWSQGLRYIGLYFQAYWIFALLPVAGAILLMRRPFRKFEKAQSPQPALIIGGACTILWLLYIMRVGGDFMFARFLIPITPLLYLLMENVVRNLLLMRKTTPGPEQFRVPVLIFWIFLLGTLLKFDPYQGKPLPRIADISEENKIYTPERFRRLREIALALKPVLFQTGPVLAYVGAQAGLVYYWTPLTAIESETGLTDKFIASRRLHERGPIGHEKTAPISYLRKRRTSFRMRPPPPERDRGFNRMRVRGMPLDWEIVVYLPPVMERLKQDARFRFPDFPKYLDGYIRSRPAAEKVRTDLEFFRPYYFNHARDAKRLKILTRLAQARDQSQPPAK